MTLILKSKPVIDLHKKVLTEKVISLKKLGITPTLKVILVGDHGPSIIYTKNKKKFCESIGADCEIIKLSESVSEKDFLDTINQIALSAEAHGFFVQLPLPTHLQHINVGKLIPPHKDVDGFHAENFAGLITGDKGEKSLIPCTPKGIITLLQHYDIPIAKKNVLVIGRSLIVGKPMQMLLTNYDATVVLAHSQTQDIKVWSSQADIIISAIGRPRYFDHECLDPNKKNQTLIDVGICYDENNKLCGDFNYDELLNKCAAITPVPGGVGPMTILSLAQNLVQAAEQAYEGRNS